MGPDARTVTGLPLVLLLLLALKRRCILFQLAHSYAPHHYLTRWEGDILYLVSAQEQNGNQRVPFRPPGGSRKGGRTRRFLTGSAVAPRPWPARR
jgi:hypothetical protein